MSQDARRTASSRPADGVDVLVLGAGPAGAAAALAYLRHTDWSVRIIDRAEAPGLALGELISPGLEPLLAFVDAADLLADGGHDPAQGVQAAWSYPQATPRDFFFSGRGGGWHLDRPKFNADLAGRAEAAGAWLDLGVVVTALDPTGEPDWRWRARLRTPTGEDTVSARMVIDASGRAAWAARRFGAQRQMADALVGISLSLVASDAAAGDAWPGATLIEAAPEGWWYSAPVPGGGLAVTLMTDADLAREGGWTSLKGWRDRLAAAPLTATRAAGRPALAVRPLVRAAHSQTLDQPCGPGWIAVGDAACAFDPLSGMGVGHALASGLNGARASEAAMRGDTALMEQYAAGVRQNAKAYQASLSASYAGVTRFGEAEFWARRIKASAAA